MKVLKGLEAIVAQLREQVEEATKPKDPSYLPQYCRSIRDSIQSVVRMFPQDPTYGALAFHGTFKFRNRNAIEKVAARLANRIAVADDMWPTLKGCIEVGDSAREAADFLEKNGQSRVLVIAVCANFSLDCRVKNTNAETSAEPSVDTDGETEKEEAHAS